MADQLLSFHGETKRLTHLTPWPPSPAPSEEGRTRVPHPLPAPGQPPGLRHLRCHRDRGTSVSVSVVTPSAAAELVNGTGVAASSPGFMCLLVFPALHHKAFYLAHFVPLSPLSGLQEIRVAT